MIHWIIQENLTKREIVEQLKSAIIQDNATWETVNIKPFSTEIPTIFNKLAFPVIYGSTTFMLNAYQDDFLKKGVFYDENTFKMSHYVNIWKSNVLNADGQLLALSQIINLKSEADKLWFIRPDDDGKTFSGKVMRFDELKTWSKKICDLNLPDFNQNTPIWLAEPKQIQKEWRLFIVDNEIVSTSKYMENGELNKSDKDIPSEMISFAKANIMKYRIADIYTFDIALCDDEYKIIECNCFNGTGFYEHNIEKIVNAVNLFIRKQLDKFI